MSLGKNCLCTAALVLAMVSVIRPAAAVADDSRPQPSPRPAVGEKARDFALNTLDGKTIRLMDLTKQGPVVLVVLRGWVGYQCPICTRQVADLLSRSKRFAAAGARVVLVYPGPSDGLKAHAQQFISGKGLPANFSFVLDPKLKLVTDWGLRWDAPRETAYPSTFVIDSNRTVRFAKVSKTHAGRASASEILAALHDQGAANN